MYKKNIKRFFFGGSIAYLYRAIRKIVLYSSGALRKHYAGLISATLLKLLAFPLALAIIYTTKSAIDLGILARDLKVFLFFTVSGFGAYALSGLLNFWAAGMVRKIKAAFSLEVNRVFTRRLFGLNFTCITSSSSDENAFTLWYDHRNVENLIFSDIPALASIVKIPVFMALAAFISIPLSLLLFAALPLILIQIAWVSRRTRKLRIREFYSARKYSSAFHDILMNIRMIKAFLKENWAAGRVSSFIEARVERELAFSLFSRKAAFWRDILIKLSTAAFAIAGGYLVISGKLTFGSFSAVSMYAVLMISEMYHAGSVVSEINGERMSYKRCADLIKRMEEAGASDGRMSAGFYPPERALSDGIEVREVSFAYPGRDALFSGISLHAPGGKWTLLKGASGVGKTTLLSLIMRLFSPCAGAILLRGKEISRLDELEMSSSISMVHQEPYLLKDTLENNILLGDNLKGADLQKAVTVTGVDKIAGMLDGGYNSCLKESGSSLSGGQKQRIAIARALVRGADFLLLDEATSFIDTEGEEDIFGNIKREYPGLAVLYVSHRDIEMKYADETYVLERGRICKHQNERVS